MSRRDHAILLCVLLTLAGCGHGLPVVPASGVVLLDGAPLVNAVVTTQPVSTGSLNPGPGSFGRTDAQGRFELELVKPAVRGAIIGEHRVMIRPASVGTADAPAKEGAGDKWPANFVDGSLRIQIPSGGTKDLRVELTRRTSGAK